MQFTPIAAPKTHYVLQVRYKDGTGHTYTDLSRSKVAELAARQFALGLDRPEEIHITTTREESCSSHRA